MYVLAYKGRSVTHTTNFESLVEICESLGCEYLQNTYQNSLCKKLLRFKKKVVQDEILKEVKASPFFAILLMYM